METLNLIVGLTLALAAIALLMWMFLTRKKRKNTNIIIDDQHLTISLPVLNRNDDGKTQFPVKEKFAIDRTTIKQLFLMSNSSLYNVMIMNSNSIIHDAFYPFSTLIMHYT